MEKVVKIVRLSETTSTPEWIDFLESAMNTRYADTGMRFVVLPEQKPRSSVHPAVILASIMWALFTVIGVCMTLGLLPVTWFGGAFVLICFLVAIFVSASVAGTKEK